MNKKPLIPPHIAWPGAVVGLLCFTFALMATMLTAVKSDGGAAVVEDYYHQAIHWDDTQRLRAASDALGWTVRIDAQPVELNGLVPVTISVRDRDGAPVEDLAGMVLARRADAASAAAHLPLAVSDAPGDYRQSLPLHRGGLWDFEIDATRGEDRFFVTVRYEL